EGPVLLVVCPEISNSENLGGLIRVSAALGATAMLLGERSCDPLFRQTIRVSMGAIFSLPIGQSRDCLADLRDLQRLGVTRIATVLDESATPLASFGPRPPRCALLFGNEAQGLPPAYVDLCERRLTIPMCLGTDSLNVAVAAGIILHHLVHQDAYPRAINQAAAVEPTISEPNSAA
ncbi:MAG: RNA methyltransferase, partial [Phycisphaerales bacterium]|nr:RNA methyltransferase [Phycisphaerales bacterium]